MTSMLDVQDLLRICFAVPGGNPSSIESVASRIRSVDDEVACDSYYNRLVGCLNKLCLKELILFKKHISVGLTNAVYAASCKGRLDILNILVKNEADINYKNSTGAHWTPLHGAVYYNQVEVVKFLLAHNANPLIKDSRDRNPLNLARSLHNQDCVKLLLQCDFKFLKPLKMCERDKLPNSSIICFKPALKQITPYFYERVVNNQKLIEILDEEEQEILQCIIKKILYEKTEEKQFDVKQKMICIFLLSSTETDLIFMKNALIRDLTRLINLKNVLDNLEIIEKYIERENAYVHIQNRESLLIEFREYCLDMLGSYSHTQDFSDFVETDMRMDNYLKQFFKRKSIRSIAINEDRDVNIQNPYVKLFNHEPSHDLRIVVGDEVTYYCHKTVLESTSFYFTDLFKSNNWSDFDTDVYKLDVEDEESVTATDYIIKYCYDLQMDIEDEQLIGVMKASHMHSIKPLITLCSKKLKISVDNFFSLVDGLYDYIEDPLFSKLHQNIIEFGVKHCKQLFAQDKKSCRKLPPSTLEEIFNRMASR